MMYLLGAGFTKGQLLRMFMGGGDVNIDNLRIAQEYLRLANQAAERLDASNLEDLNDSNLQNMINSIMGDEEEEDFSNMF